MRSPGPFPGSPTRSDHPQTSQYKRTSDTGIDSPPSVVIAFVPGLMKKVSTLSDGSNCVQTRPVQPFGRSFTSRHSSIWRRLGGGLHVNRVATTFLLFLAVCVAQQP